MVAAQVADQLAYLDDLARVQADGRLVQDQNLRVSDQGLRETYALLVTFGQVADHSGLHVGNAHQLANFIDMALPLLLGNVFKVTDETQVFLNRHIHVQRRLLR